MTASSAAGRAVDLARSACSGSAFFPGCVADLQAAS